METAPDDARRGVAAETVVHLEGRLDAPAVAAARDVVLQAMSQGDGDLVLDCSAVECVDVAGLGLIISTHARLRGESRRLVLVGCRPQVRRALAVTRLSRILPMQSRELGS